MLSGVGCHVDLLQPLRPLITSGVSLSLPEKRTGFASLELLSAWSLKLNPTNP